MSGFKRTRQPKMSTHALLSFEDLGGSSSDSDFRIEDHCSDGSKDEERSDSGADSAASSSDSDSDDEDASEDSTQLLKEMLAEELDGGEGVTNDDLENVLRQLDSKEIEQQQQKVPLKPICCVCLGERSDDSNEIVECDGCGVSVHEGCYGVSENASISSTNSTCSTEPWFCEACRAGVADPICELCPNAGGIFKETDVGKWVHLVCALYVPGVAFGEVDQLSSVTLFEMQYSKWGAKLCSLCENSRFARTGVAIGCDAGMCKTYFHVTCAQAAGFLTEAHHEDADAADPFYAHCKVHSEKEMIRKRRRNFHTFRMNMQQKLKEKMMLKHDDPCPAQIRIQRKLLKSQQKYSLHKQHKVQPWVPTQKMSRLLTTSASACKRLLAKADTMAVDVELLERQEQQITALQDIRKKWHIAPAFSVEFFGYYLDRISRAKELKQQLTEMVEMNKSLTEEQSKLRKEYDSHLEQNKEAKANNETLMSTIGEIHRQISALCPSKNLPDPHTLGQVQQHAEPIKAPTPTARPISVPTAAALKMGVGFPLSHLGPPGSKIDSNRLLSTHVNSPTAALGSPSTSSTPTLGVQAFECGICKRSNDQHLLAKCDTCKLHYHLGCLNPPLTRHPKKSKLYGWQCSECDKSDDSDTAPDVPKGPRKARTRFNRDGSILAFDKDYEFNILGEQPKRHSLDSNPSESTGKKGNKKSLSNYADNSEQHTTSSSPIRKFKPDASMEQLEITQGRVNLSPGYNNKKSKNVTKCTVTTTSFGETAIEVPLTKADLPTTDNTAADPLALPSNTTQLEDSPDQSKQARKQKRKEKHKNKHSLSSDAEKSPNKEHKRKRKKKEHDTQSQSGASDTVRKIKIKFKTLPLPGEPQPETKFFYVVADTVRSDEEMSRPTSVETIEEIHAAQANPIQEDPITLSPHKPVTPLIPISPSVKPTEQLTSPVAVNNSPSSSARKSSPRKNTNRSNATARQSNASATPKKMLSCCVCTAIGLVTNTVTCDECHRAYHFSCLDPPLKKTPKIRGYCWICAECDVTDDEKK